MGECGASVLLYLLVGLFRNLFLKGIESVCDEYRKLQSTIHEHPSSIQHEVVKNNNKDEDEDKWHIGEVQRFFGWAIKEAINYWKDKFNKEHLISENEMQAQMSNAYKCLTVVRSMRCFHNEILFDEDYVRQYYPISIASQNRGWLCLVAKPFFVWANSCWVKSIQKQQIKK